MRTEMTGGAEPTAPGNENSGDALQESRQRGNRMCENRTQEILLPENRQQSSLRHVALRPMTADDIRAVAAIEAACFSDAWSERLIGELPESEWDETWLLETEEKAVCGYANFRFLAGEGELMRIAVLPEFRGRGYARTLMDQLLLSAAKREVSALTLEVRAGNETALALYHAFGFRNEAVRKHYYHDPEEDAVIMWRREKE